MVLPRLYAILDVDVLAACAFDVGSYASELRDAGIKLLQYRNKQGSARAILRDAATLREIFPTGRDVPLVMNDRADLAMLSSFDGVHIGQEDLVPEDARGIVGPDRWVGTSTHSPQQVIDANETTCDYIAYGPIFSTSTKSNPDRTVGLAGLKMARTLTRKPLVAIGGITRENCRSVVGAGADSVAVISGLLPTRGKSTRPIAEEFLALLAKE